MVGNYGIIISNLDRHGREQRYDKIKFRQAWYVRGYVL